MIYGNFRKHVNRGQLVVPTNISEIAVKNIER